MRLKERVCFSQETPNTSPRVTNRYKSQTWCFNAMTPHMPHLYNNTHVLEYTFSWTWFCFSFFSLHLSHSQTASFLPPTLNPPDLPSLGILMNPMYGSVCRDFCKFQAPINFAQIPVEKNSAPQIQIWEACEWLLPIKRESQWQIGYTVYNTVRVFTHLWECWSWSPALSPPGDRGPPPVTGLAPVPTGSEWPPVAASSSDPA